MSSGSGRGKEKGPEPEHNITVHPQENVIIPVDSSAWVHCVANITAVEGDYDYANDGPMIMGEFLPSDDDFNFHQNDDPNDNSMDSSQNFSKYSCKQEVQYQWFQNGKKISNQNSYAETFCNGTIKIKYVPMAEGVYRCLAETTHIEHGAVVSKAATVKLAGMYFFTII